MQLANRLPRLDLARLTDKQQKQVVTLNLTPRSTQRSRSTKRSGDNGKDIRLVPSILEGRLTDKSKLDLFESMAVLVVVNNFEHHFVLITLMKRNYRIKLLKQAGVLFVHALLVEIFVQCFPSTV